MVSVCDGRVWEYLLSLIPFPNTDVPGLARAGAANLLSLGVAVGAVILALSIFGALRFGKDQANAAPETNAS